MAEAEKTIVLFAVALVPERERQPTVQGRPLLVGIALYDDIDVFWEIKVLREQP